MHLVDPPGGRLQPTPVPPDDSAYWSFYARVASAQLSEWLPTSPARVLDLSGCSAFSGQLVAAGHEVVHAAAQVSSCPEQPAGAGRLLSVVADTRSLGWLADGSVDVVLAESRMLSMCLAAEVTLEHLVRVLRPGGRLLLVVDSLALGLARLADQGRWAELADVPAADVVLVPAEDGTITRCFWPEELHDLLAGAGMTVDWVRARSVLAVATVERALQQGGEAALPTLVKTELAHAADRHGESSGLHRVASARLPG